MNFLNARKRKGNLSYIGAKELMDGKESVDVEGGSVQIHSPKEGDSPIIKD